MDKPRISVAMAAYNGAPFIAEQLRSILNQTLIPDEIVICDDSGDDSTKNAVAPFIADTPAKIRYFRNEPRLGVSANFEKAISLTTGDIIFLADQDDVWQPEKVEILAGLIAATPSPCGSFSNSRIVDESLTATGATQWGSRGFNSPEVEKYFQCKTATDRLRFFLPRVPTAGHNMAFSAALKKIILPFPDLRECHDTWIALVIAAAAEWRISAQELTLFRQHGNNTSGAGHAVGPFGQWRQAKASIANDSFSWYVKLYDALTARLQEQGRVCDPEILQLLNDRREHSAARAAMNCGMRQRLPLVLKEIRNRRYFRYGRGWKNVIQDLMMR